MKNYIKTFGLIAVTSLLSWQTIFAKGSSGLDSYNFQRGMEAYQNGDKKTALDFWEKELEDNAKNGYAQLWTGIVLSDEGNFSKGINYIDEGLRNIPKSDKNYQCAGYGAKAMCYELLGDTAQALATFSQAIKIAPENENIYVKRGVLLGENRQYEKAKADFNKVLSINPGNVNAAYNLGLLDVKQKNYDAAIKQFNFADKLCNHSEGIVLAYRAEAYLGKDKPGDATDDLIEAYSIDRSSKAISKMSELEGQAKQMLDTKIKIQMMKNANANEWPFLAGVLAADKNDYQAAVDYYKKADEMEPSSFIKLQLANCYTQLGDYSEALNQWHAAYDLDSTTANLQDEKCQIFFEAGEYDSCKVECDKYVANNVDNPTAYMRRAILRREVGDYAGAKEDMNTYLALDPDDTYALLMRGVCNDKLGNKDEAETDFRRIVKIDTTYNASNYASYAYYYLGDKVKAIAITDSCIAHAAKKRNMAKYGVEYNAACLYSLMNDKDNALLHLRKALELGFRSFAHIRRDNDLDNIRNDAKFQSLINEYESKVQASNTKSAGVKGTKTTEVPFTRESGVCKVKCNINGLQLHFIFDTGASSVSISNVEATFMLKNGYLKESDVVGSQSFMDANGNISVGTVINLRKVNFGGLELNNVRASVVQNQKAPLLLGQSVLSRLGKIEIDNQKRVLRITQNTTKATATTAKKSTAKKK